VVRTGPPNHLDREIYVAPDHNSQQSEPKQTFMGGLLGFLPDPSSAVDTTQYTLLPSMPSSIHKDIQDEEEPGRPNDSDINLDPDAEFGGSEGRKRLEKTLLLKLDLRMSILIVIYILNYVRASIYNAFLNLIYRDRSTEIMPRQSFLIWSQSNVSRER
jgi:hypothetical protein